MDWTAFRANDHLSRLEVCAFCRRDAEAVAGFVAGHEAGMCSDCAAVLADELADARDARLRERARALPAPARIHAWLDERVVGQEAAKRVLAVQAHTHYKRLLWRGALGGGRPGKANVLLTGPTGSGKTRLKETLARCLDAPLAGEDATTLTPPGQQGADVDTVAKALRRASDWDAACAARGIVYIDEIDKLGGPDADGRGTAVQQALLSLVEGRRVRVPRPAGGVCSVSTRDVLFVAGGAFSADATAPAAGGAAWLRAQGLIPELVGRFPVHVPLAPADPALLRRLLSEPPDAPLRQMAALLARDGCTLEVTSAAVERLAADAHARGGGARALHGCVERALRDALFHVPARPEVVRVRLDADAGGVTVALEEDAPPLRRRQSAA